MIKAIIPHVFFIIVILCTAFTGTHAQTGSLQLALSPLPELKDSTRHLKLRIYVVNNDTTAAPNPVADSELQHWSSAVRFDGLAAGTYHIAIEGEYEDICCAPGYRYRLKNVTGPAVVVTAGNATATAATFPAPCAYYKDFTHRECPKCHKSDQVLPNEWGDPVVDPETGKIPYEDTYHWDDGHDPTGCDPVWYCKRDNIMF